MITVKGTQSGTESTDPAAPYARKPEEKSGAVAKVSLLLAAVVLYLKAFVSGNAEAADDAPSGEASDEGAPAPLVTVVSSGMQHQDLTGKSSGDALVGHSSPVSFTVAPGTDTIAFADAERQVVSPVFRSTGDIAAQANDSEPPGPGAAGFRIWPAASGAATGAGNPGAVPGDAPSVAPDTSPPVDPQPEDPDDGTDPDEDATGDGDGPDTGGPDPSVNRAPRLTGPVYLNDISGCAVLAIGLAELLRGAVDPDGDALSVTGLASSSGKLTMVEAGLWEFSPGAKLGPVTITYRISDGSLEVSQTLHFVVVPTQSINGTDHDDILIGTMCADDIEAGAGNDLVDARAGDDVIDGGAGSDHILGGEGDDLIHGGDGDDVILGGAGQDEIHGDGGSDRLFGEAGDDTLTGGSGDDFIWGGSGDDHVSGGDGDDRLLGGSGDDRILGDGGDDTIGGGEGDDLILADRGNDLVRGGGGIDRLSGGRGHDRLFGDEGNDIIVGEEGNDVLWGGGGADRLSGGDGDDILKGGTGEDVVLAGKGNDRVVGAADGVDDRYHGGEGFDLLDYSATGGDLEVDLAGGRAKGTETGEDGISGFERIATGSGDDIIRFGGSAVSMSGGEGCNTFVFAPPETALDMPQRQDRQTIHQMEDFKVGDRLQMSKWEIFEEAVDAFEDRFERLYGDRLNKDDVPIRYQNDWSEAMTETIVEADLDGDDFYETAIILDGRHALVFFENA